MPQVVVFDMDGVLVDTESVWDEVRAELAADWGGAYHPRAQRAMMGMSSGEWSSYMHRELGLPQPPEEINREVVARMLDRYHHDLPVVPGGADAVRRLAAAGHPLGLASSSNRELIDAVLTRMGLTDLFAVTVSSEEVEHGKPSPDVYLAAVGALGAEPGTGAAIEDSSNGIRAAAAAGLQVVVYPNRTFPPSSDALALAATVIDSLDELDSPLIESLSARRPPA